jgi:hypothetical protein
MAVRAEIRKRRPDVTLEELDQTVRTIADRMPPWAKLPAQPAWSQAPFPYP